MNIRKILEPASKRKVKVWSDTFGPLELSSLTPTGMILVDSANYQREYTNEGRYQHSPITAPCSIFPDKNNRDWEKWQISLLKPDEYITSKVLGKTLKIISFQGGRIVAQDSSRNTMSVEFFSVRFSTEEEIIEYENQVDENTTMDDYNDPSNSILTPSPQEEKLLLDVCGSDGFAKNCPYGASISFPKQPLKRIHVGSEDCQRCECFGGEVEKGKIIKCKYNQ